MHGSVGYWWRNTRFPHSFPEVETITQATSGRTTLYLVGAWRLDRLMCLGRMLPELPADVLLQADEWKAAYLLNHKKVPKQASPLREAIRRIAWLGGFWGRKGNSEPGAKTLWLGLRDIAVFVDGIQADRQEERCV